MFGGGNHWWRMKIELLILIGSAWQDWWCSIDWGPFHHISSAGILALDPSLITYSIYWATHTRWGSVSNLFAFASITGGAWSNQLMDGCTGWLLSTCAMVTLGWWWSIHPWSYFLRKRISRWWVVLLVDMVCSPSTFWGLVFFVRVYILC